MHGACDRARQWATADVDGELSKFEGVLLRAHLDGCPPCAEFHASIAGLTQVIRQTPLERLERFIEIKRVRRKLGLRLAPAAAAMAVLFGVLGSSLVSSQIRTSSVGSAAARNEGRSLGPVDALNLSTARALENASPVIRTAPAGRSPRSLRGGPVVRER